MDSKPTAKPRWFTERPRARKRTVEVPKEQLSLEPVRQRLEQNGALDWYYKAKGQEKLVPLDDDACDHYALYLRMSDGSLWTITTTTLPDGAIAYIAYDKGQVRGPNSALGWKSELPEQRFECVHCHAQFSTYEEASTHFVRQSAVQNDHGVLK